MSTPPAFIGNWAVDLEAFQALPVIQALSDAERQRAISYAKRIGVDFLADGSIRALFDAEEQSGTYQVSAQDGGNYTLQTTLSGAGESEIRLQVNGDKMSLASAGGTLPLKKEAQ